jgi:uncharacterized protein (DUF2336 family)
MTVAHMRASLTPDDVKRLIRGETPEERATSVRRLGKRIDMIELTETDRAVASQLLTMLASDAADLVRKSLAETLRNSPNLPREAALKLANDIDAVAAPLLQGSPVLTDEDLVELVINGSPLKQVAIAGRASVGEALTEVIANYGCREAVSTVSANNGAAFTDTAYGGVLKRFGSDEAVTGALISRASIPPHITEKLVSLVSGALFDRLVNTHELPPQLAIEIASGARERATIDLVEQAGLSSDPERFAQQLHLNGRLTPSLVMRALCLGHVTFVEHALAELSGIPRSKAWLLIHDAGSLGLKTLFERSGMPSGMFTAFRMAVEVYHKTDMSSDADGRSRFRQKMVERVLTQFQAIPRADLEYLMEKLDALEEARGATRTAAAG